MTVPSATSRSTYAGNGVTTVFSTGFYFLEQGHVVVKLTLSGGSQITQTLGVHYTVTQPAGVGLNGSITMLAAPPALSSLVVERTLPIVQETSLRGQGSFAPAIHEDAFDEGICVDQQLARRISDLESAGAPGSVIAGNGVSFTGSTINVGAGAGIQSNADTVEVVFGVRGSLLSVVTDQGSTVTGVLAQAARIDHGHIVLTDAAGPIAVGDAAALGSWTFVARADHRHSLAAPAAPVSVQRVANAAGVSPNVARSDHQHDVSVAAPVTIADSANADGAAATIARSDHVHAHGNRGGGTLHAVAVSAGNAGFMSGADKAKLDALLAELVVEGLAKTTDATPTLLLSYTPDDNSAENIDIRVVAVSENSAQAAGYNIRATVRRKDGVTTITGQARVTADAKTNAALDLVLAASSPLLTITGTGLAATSIFWRVQVRRIKLLQAGTF